MKKILLILFVITGLSAFSQERNVQGIVSDDNGEPIPGVNVVEKGTTKGTITNIDGEYNFIVPSEKSVLVFSFIGFATQEIVVGEITTLNVKLQPDAIGLEEVVAVGYGTVKKSDLTGSVASVKSDDISNAGTVSLDQALAGRASGVLVTQSSGVPGSGSTIKIRGINSMMGSEPLYIIDGVAIDNTSTSSMNDEAEDSGTISPLSSINSSDIESMEILKDASATAIYGSRGANGVVIITTKSGKSGKGKVEIDAEYGISELPHQIDVQDANQYWLTRYEALYNANSLSASESVEEKRDSALAGLLPTTNWQDAIFRQGSSQNYNLKFSGGGDGIKYLISSNVFDAEGIVEQTDFNRVSTRVNLDADVNDFVDVGTRMYYAVVNSNQQSTNTNYQANMGTNSIIMRALVTSPSAALDADEDDEGVAYYTPLMALEANSYENFISQFVGNMFVNVKLSKGLVFKTDVSAQIRNTNQRFYQKDILPDAYSLGGWSKTNDSRVRMYSNTNTLSYNRKFGLHNFNAVIGQSAEWFDSEAVITSNYGYANDLLTYYAPETASFYNADQVNYTDSRLVSFFGRVNYNYKSKLLVTLTGRADGSSKFAANNKFAFFPAVAVGYRLSEESFIKDISSITNLKLRASYGLSGNQAISSYQSLDQLASDKVTFGDGSGGETFSTIYYSSQLPNADLRWETTAQADFGVDFGMFDNRFSITADYFNKITDDLLVSGNRIPSQSGFTTYTENLGQMSSNGFEFAVNANIVNRKKFSWILGANFSVGKTKIKDMGDDYIESGYNQGWVSGGTQRLVIGEEIGAFYGYKTSGISQFSDFEEFEGLTQDEASELYLNNDPQTVYTPFLDENGSGVSTDRPGEQIYEDVNEDGAIDELDKSIIGYAQPDFSFGLNNSFSYKDFELSFFIDGQFGHQVCNVSNFNLLMFGAGQQLATVREAWTTENQSDIYPRVDALNSSSSFKFSDRYLEDASFIRLQNVTVSYNLPASICKKIRMTGAKVYMSGSNLFTITDYTGYNPDVSLTGSNNLQMGHDNAGYPVARTVRIGVKLKL
jgi:TonB-linked SusC/RagA family outer membrane protein